jgi:hypothetical protein
VTHALVASEATPEQWAALSAYLRERRRGVSRAWFARRLLPGAPEERTYVLALQLNGWSQYWERDQAIVDRFDDFPFPAHVMVCTVSGAYAPLRKVLRKMPGCEIDLRG